MDDVIELGYIKEGIMPELSVAVSIILVIIGVISALVGGLMAWFSQEKKRENFGLGLFIGGILIAAGTIIYNGFF